MIQYKNPLPNGGVPFFADDFTFLQGMQMGFVNIMLDEYYNLAAQASPSGGRSLIMSGLNVVLSSVSVVSSISSGYVMLNEVLYYFGGGTDMSSTSIYIVPDTDSEEEFRQLEDQNTGVIKIQKKAKWQTSVPGDSVPFIFFNPLSSVYLKDLIFRASKRIGEIVALGNRGAISPLKGPSDIDWFIPTPATGSVPANAGKGKFSYDGFAVCNGKNGTPDLNGRFMVGYNTRDGDYASVGNAGPNPNPANYDLIENGKAVRLKTPAMPSHSHSGSAETGGVHSHGLWLSKAPGMTGGSGGVASSYQDGSHPLNGGINNGGAHGHSLQINSTGGDQPHENRPPYYTTLYIMRIG